MTESVQNTCPICNEAVLMEMRECPNCGAELGQQVAVRPEPADAPTAKSGRKFHPRRKTAQRRSQYRQVGKLFTKIAGFLQKNQLEDALQVYQKIEWDGKKRNHLDELLRQSIRLGRDSLNFAVEKSREATRPAIPRPQLEAARKPISRIFLIPLIVLALIGAWSLVRPGSPAQGVAPTFAPTWTLLPEPTASISPALPTQTPSPTPLPLLLPITASKIDQVAELFTWPAGQEIVSLSFSPNGNLLASGDSGGSVSVWLLWQQQPLYQLDGMYADFSPNGEWLAVAGQAGLSLYRASDGQLVKHINQERAYYSVLFSPDSSVIAAGANNTRFYVFSVNDASELKAGGGFENAVYNLSFSRDGRLIAAASQKTTYVWNFQLQKVERNMPPRAEPPIYFSVALDADGEWFATGQKDGQMYIWRVSNGERMAAFNDKSRFVYGLQFLKNANSPEILVSGDEVNLSFWQMYGYDTTLRRSIFSSAPIRSLAIASGDQLIATGRADGVIQLWGVRP